MSNASTCLLTAVALLAGGLANPVFAGGLGSPGHSGVGTGGRHGFAGPAGLHPAGGRHVLHRPATRWARPGFGARLDALPVRHRSRSVPYGLGAYGFGALPLIRHRAHYLDHPAQFVEPAYAPARLPVAPYPMVPSLADLPAETGIREAGPARPALYVINRSGRVAGGLRPSAKVVDLGTPSRSGGRSGARVVEVRVPRGR